MCDTCLDMTVWNGTLINSCRRDEYRLLGRMLAVADKAHAEPAPAEQQRRGELPGISCQPAFSIQWRRV